MSIAKMRIKMGLIEVDYEGTEDFLKQELPEILTAVSSLYRESGLVGALQPSLHTPSAETQLTPVDQMSVTTIAAKLNAQSGPSLVLAAAARLTRSGTAQLPRSKILEEMKAATGFYKSSYSGNLSKILLSLVKEGKLQEVSKDTYTLSVNAVRDIEAKLVN
jgi:hypothetical protein